MQHILIVEDEDIIRASLRKLLERHGYLVSDAVSVKVACETFNLKQFALIVSDLRLPGARGTDLIKLAEPTPVLIMTSYASLKSAVDTMRQGAVDYISKPFSHEQLIQAIEAVLSKQPAAEEKPDTPLAALSGSSPAITQLMKNIERAADSRMPVLIEGECGSGKSLAAAAIHQRSHNSGELHSINCLSINAAQMQETLNQCSSNDTLLLDHIEDLPQDAQTLLISALDQAGHRIIATTAGNPEKLCDNGYLRKELLYRIKVIHLKLPALRDRLEDIDLLASHFLYGEPRTAPVISDEVLQRLKCHDWPGNVQELYNCLRQAQLLAGSNAITCDHLSLPETTQAHSASSTSSDLSLEDYFTRFVLDHQSQMTETQLAEKLGISRKSLWERRQKLGLSRPKKS